MQPTAGAHAGLHQWLEVHLLLVATVPELASSAPSTSAEEIYSHATSSRGTCSPAVVGSAPVAGCYGWNGHKPGLFWSSISRKVGIVQIF